MLYHPPLDPLDWLRRYWRQDTTRTKTINGMWTREGWVWWGEFLSLIGKDQSFDAIGESK